MGRRLGACWGHLGLSWGHVGVFGGHLGASRGHLGAILGPHPPPQGRCGTQSTGVKRCKRPSSPALSLPTFDPCFDIASKVKKCRILMTVVTFWRSQVSNLRGSGDPFGGPSGPQMGGDLWRGGVLGPLGAILGSLGAILGPFGAILEPLGAIVGPSWDMTLRHPHPPRSPG